MYLSFDRNESVLLILWLIYIICLNLALIFSTYSINNLYYSTCLLSDYTESILLVTMDNLQIL